ncbi:MAG: hypothetical protein COV73_06330 [Candidatus Omnitrophica bacterium CG11_big_fil_rev_8_21_14_0_20_43_6]|nr:MAG: hypothetical protein COV73_06330 [Candidatus Omnitrophica bacterium CG11_big_fil_rev_8_21_14_0_20_43_6]
MRKISLFLACLASLVLPGSAWALDLEVLKSNFLQGNYRRVIFEGQAGVNRLHLGNTDELNYILGLSYLKESKLDLAQDAFRRILSNSNSKLKAEAALALADTYLVSGQFNQAEEGYNKLISGGSNSRQKSAVLYRLSQLESKRGDHQKSSEYLFKLKRDFPLSPELRVIKGITFINTSTSAVVCEPAVTVFAETGEYSVQAGFFTSSANANNLKDRLLMKDYAAYVENSGTGYRVKVGRVKSKREALDLENKLSRDGFQTKICPL